MPQAQAPLAAQTAPSARTTVKPDKTPARTAPPESTKTRRAAKCAKPAPPGYQTNTDKDGCNICPANTFTQPLYFEMTSGSCAEYITTQVECDAARAFFGSEVGTGSVGSDNYYPRGCISYENPDPIAKKFWFNALTSSSSSRDCGFSSYSCICKSSNPVTTCTDCPFGKYSAAGSSAGSSACKIPQCPAGGYFSATAGDCVDCAAGRYNDQVGQDSPNTCAACAVGRYSDQVGQSSSTACQACAAGKYQQYTAQVGCYNCPAGWYQDYAGQNQCAQCTGGHIRRERGHHRVHRLRRGQIPRRVCSDEQQQLQKLPRRLVHVRPLQPVVLRLRRRQVLESGWSNQQQHLRGLRCRVLRGGKRQRCLRGVRSREFLVTSGRSSAWDCKGCDAGRYAASTGTTSCTDCAIGRYSDTAALPARTAPPESTKTRAAAKCAKPAPPATKETTPKTAAKNVPQTPLRNRCTSR